VNLRGLLRLAILATGVLGLGGVPAAAQHPVEGMEFMFDNLRPSGQPVIPIFDGWYPKPDGSHELCFGYFSLNTEQVVEIPLGANNFIEPKQFNGEQPTHFLPVPGPPNLYRRFFCALVVNLPKGTPKTARVVWTLVQKGKSFSVPGHLGSINYQIQELTAEDGARSSKAPVIKYMPNGPEGRGRSGVRTSMTAKVGQSLELPLSVTGPPAGPQGVDPDSGDDEERPYIRDGKKRIWWVKWAKHQGPGAVTFSPSEIDVWEGEKVANAKATFSAPGEYVLRVQAIDNPAENASYQFHCCWTNGFVKVTVAP
jgi:hypothetical protein